MPEGKPGPTRAVRDNPWESDAWLRTWRAKPLTNLLSCVWGESHNRFMQGFLMKNWLPAVLACSLVAATALRGSTLYTVSAYAAAGLAVNTCSQSTAAPVQCSVNAQSDPFLASASATGGIDPYPAEWNI